MTNQPIDLLQPSQEKATQGVLKLRTIRTSHYDFVKRHQAWKDKADIAIEMGLEVTEEPQRSPEDQAGLDSINVELDSEQKFTRALQKSFEARREASRSSRGSGADVEIDRTQVKDLIANASTQYDTDPAKKVSQVLGMAHSAIQHVHTEAFEDLAAILKISPDVLQFEPRMVIKIKEKFDYARRENPRLLQDNSVHEIFSLILENANLNREQREEIGFLLDEGKAARGTDALYKRAQIVPGYDPIVSMTAVEVALGLSDEEVQRISSNVGRGEVSTDQLLKGFAKAIVAGDHSHALNNQAKLLGMMQSYAQHIPALPDQYGTERDQSRDRRVQMNNVLAQVAISLVDEDTSAWKVVAGEAESNLSPLFIRELPKLLQHENGMMKAEELFKAQHRRVIDRESAREEAKKAQVAKEQAEQEAQRARVEQEAWEEKKRQLEQLQADPEYQAATHALLELHPTLTSADSLVRNVNEALQAVKIKEPVAQQLLAVLADYRSLLSGEYFRYEDNEVVDSRGVFGVGKKTHMERKYSAIGKKLEEEEARLRVKAEQRDEEALTRLAALGLLKKYVGRSMSL